MCLIQQIIRIEINILNFFLLQTFPFTQEDSVLPYCYHQKYVILFIKLKCRVVAKALKS